MVQNVAEQAEKKRDLKGQLAGLTKQEQGEIIFTHISPGRAPVTIYSTQNGEPVEVPAYMVDAVMTKTLDDGKFMFVAKKEDAPEFKPGTVKCFLHPESPERAILEEIGLSGTACPNDHLANQHSKRIHGEHRHKQEWAAYQSYLTDRKEERTQDRQDKQLAATLDIARAAGGQPPEKRADPAESNAACNSCGGSIEGKLADHQCK